MSGKAVQAADLSDATVFGKARQALDNCASVPGTVRVHVENGVVTLTGSVQRPSQRRDAERAVRPAIGKRRLLDKITVAQIPDAESLDAL